MIKSFALGNFFGLGLVKPRNKVSVIKKEENKYKFWLASILIGLNLIFLMSYIYGVNEYAASGYEIKSLQKNLAELNSSYKKLNIKASEAVSMVEIQNDFLNANFVAGGTTKYLQTTQLTHR